MDHKLMDIRELLLTVQTPARADLAHLDVVDRLQTVPEFGLTLGNADLKHMPPGVLDFPSDLTYPMDREIEVPGLLLKVHVPIEVEPVTGGPRVSTLLLGHKGILP